MPMSRSFIYLRSLRSLRFYSSSHLSIAPPGGWGDFNPNLEQLDLDNVKPPKYKQPIANHFIQYKGNRKPTTSRQPVLFLHGLFGSTQNFRSAARTLSDELRRPMYAMDLRNHGASPARFPHDYETMARDVIYSIKLNKLHRVTLAGHSMGAKVAMLVALLEPSLVGKLVVIDNSPIEAPLDPLFYRQLVGLCHVERQVPPQNIKKRKDLKLPVAQKLLAKVIHPYESDPRNKMFLLSGLRTNAKTRVRVPVLQFLLHDVLAEMGKWPHELVQDCKFDGPVKIMKAKHSNFIDGNQIDHHFGPYFSNIEYEEYDTSHWLVTDAPDQFVCSMLKFIEQ